VGGTRYLVFSLEVAERTLASGGGGGAINDELEKATPSCCLLSNAFSQAQA
jgi:hypothetical protein